MPDIAHCLKCSTIRSRAPKSEMFGTYANCPVDNHAHVWSDRQTHYPAHGDPRAAEGNEVCKHCNTILSFPMVPPACDATTDHFHEFIPYPVDSDQFPTDADMASLLRESDMADVKSLLSITEASDRDRAHDMIAEQMADVAGKRGEERRIFIKGYKEMISKAVESLNQHSTPTPGFPMPTLPPTPPPPPPCSIHTYIEKGVGAGAAICQIDMGAILSKSVRLTIDLNSFVSRFYQFDYDNVQQFGSDLTRAFLLYLRDYKSWQESMIAAGYVQTYNPGGSASIVQGITDLLSNPTIQAFLESGDSQ